MVASLVPIERARNAGELNMSQSNQDKLRSIVERTDFLRAVNFTPEQREYINNVEDWVCRDPYEAAQYIAWLEDALSDE